MTAGGDEHGAQRGIGAENLRRPAIDGGAPAGEPVIREHHEARTLQIASITTCCSSGVLTATGSEAAHPSTWKLALHNRSLVKIEGGIETLPTAASPGSAVTRWCTTQARREGGGPFPDLPATSALEDLRATLGRRVSTPPRSERRINPARGDSTFRASTGRRARWAESRTSRGFRTNRRN